MQDVKESIAAYQENAVPVTVNVPLNIPQAQIISFCRRNKIRWLALFGSVLREDFGPESDVDVLVDFEPEARIGFMALGRMQRELSAILQRPVDLVPREGLKSHLRESVLAASKVLYAA
jgi:hypothetical protein